MNWLNVVENNRSYIDRKVDLLLPSDNGGIGVSTCWIGNEVYETALIDAIGAHPVERYRTFEASILGHERWVNFSREYTNSVVLELSNRDFVKAWPIRLRRVSNNLYWDVD